MIKRTNHYFLLLLVLFITSCNCDDMPCETLEPQYLSWTTLEAGENLKYINSNGLEINFIADAKKSTPASIGCHPNGFGGCACGGCGHTYIETKAKTSDTSRRGVDSYGRRYYATELKSRVEKLYPDSNLVMLYYSIFFHSNSVRIGPSVVLNNPADTLLPTFTIGSRTYYDVIVHEADTSANYVFAWKTYYTKGFGVIAFFDRKTQSMFYRMP